MKVADTKIVKGVREFLSDILTGSGELGMEDCSCINTEINIGDTLKGKNQEKKSLNLNFSVAPDNFPGIFDEEDYLKKIQDGLSNRIGKKIRYLKVNWTFQDNVAEEPKKPCCISFEVKLA